MTDHATIIEEARRSLEQLWDCTCPEQLARIAGEVPTCERCDALVALDAAVLRHRRLEKALTRISRRDVRAQRPEARAWDYEQVAAEALNG